MSVKNTIRRIRRLRAVRAQMLAAMRQDRPAEWTCELWQLWQLYFPGEPMPMNVAHLKRFGSSGYQYDCPLEGCNGLVMRAWDQEILLRMGRFVLEAHSGCSGCGRRFAIYEGVAPPLPPPGPPPWTKAF